MFDFLGPFSLIVFFVIGIVIGAVVFPLKWLKANGWLQIVGIALTLFSMGASMAGSPTFFADLRSAGMKAFLYALVSIAGSVLAVFLLCRAVMKKGEDDK